MRPALTSASHCSLRCAWRLSRTLRVFAREGASKNPTPLAPGRIESTSRTARIKYEACSPSAEESAALSSLRRLDHLSAFHHEFAARSLSLTACEVFP